MDRVFISIGNINIYWYSVLIVMSIVIGMYFSLKEANKNDWRKTGDWQPGWIYEIK